MLKLMMKSVSAAVIVPGSALLRLFGWRQEDEETLVSLFVAVVAVLFWHGLLQYPLCLDGADQFCPAAYYGYWLWK